MSVVIPANTSIPTRERKTFATTEDNQTYVAIEIYQGEDELASRNRRLGRFVLGDLRPAPRGVTRVEVSFTMGADGILEITASEIGTGRAASLQIEAASGLTAEEMQRIGKRLSA
jgi:molecular chaperone DnaK